MSLVFTSSNLSRVNLHLYLYCSSGLRLKENPEHSSEFTQADAHFTNASLVFCKFCSIPIPFSSTLAGIPSMFKHENSPSCVRIPHLGTCI